MICKTKSILEVCISAPSVTESKKDYAAVVLLVAHVNVLVVIYNNFTGQ